MNPSEIALFEDPVKVLIVDDHDAIRFGFKAQCPEYNFELVTEAASAKAAIEKLGSQDCQVAVLDLSLGDGSAVTENVALFVERDIQVVVYSIGDKRDLVQEAIRAGAATAVYKSQEMNDLATIIYLASHGVDLTNHLTAAAIDADVAFKDAMLSDREREVLSIYASGMTQKQVAHSLGIKNSTVKEHLDRIRRKFANVGRPITDKTDFLKRALEDGIIDDIA